MRLFSWFLAAKTSNLLWELWRSILISGAVVYPKSSQIPSCNHPIDLMVLLDSSGSVMLTWNNTIDFTEKLLSNFNISDNDVRVGLIEFSMVANALIPLDSGNTLGRLYQALEGARISPQNGETHTDKALYLASTIFRASPRAYTVPRVSLPFSHIQNNNSNNNNNTDIYRGLSHSRVLFMRVLYLTNCSNSFKTLHLHKIKSKRHVLCTNTNLIHKPIYGIETDWF